MRSCALRRYCHALAISPNALENWLRPCADLEREEERADAQAPGAHEVRAGGEQSRLHEQGHHPQVDVVPGEQPCAGHRGAERALGDAGDAPRSWSSRPNAFTTRIPRTGLVDGGGDLGALVELGPAQSPQPAPEFVDQPDVDREREDRSTPMIGLMMVTMTETDEQIGA